MPELPEVESTVRYLRERVLGESFLRVDVHWDRTVDRPGVAEFKRQISGSRIASVERRGKYVLARLEDAQRGTHYLLGHLRMSGSFDVVTATADQSKHDRLVFHLKNGKQIRFNDPRKFGRVYLVRDPQQVIGKLGPEPLEELFTSEILFRGLKGKRGAIKPLLLNQSFVAGIGNIYADEALWRSRINPRCKAARVTCQQAKRLHAAIREVLTAAIASQGTDFGDGVVTEGMYEPKVYGREGEPCFRCRKTIKKIFLGQRGTHFCPACQR